MLVCAGAGGSGTVTFHAGRAGTACPYFCRTVCAPDGTAPADIADIRMGPALLRSFSSCHSTEQQAPHSSFVSFVMLRGWQNPVMRRGSAPRHCSKHTAVGQQCQGPGAGPGKYDAGASHRLSRRPSVLRDAAPAMARPPRQPMRRRSATALSNSRAPLANLHQSRPSGSVERSGWFARASASQCNRQRQPLNPQAQIACC